MKDVMRLTKGIPMVSRVSTFNGGLKRGKIYLVSMVDTPRGLRAMVSVDERSRAEQTYDPRVFSLVTSSKF